MPFRVVSERPWESAETFSRILTEAWAPPCLSYTPEYVHWQLSAPGATAILAWDGDEAVGCLAILPRRVRFGGTTQSIGLLTFVAVRPAWKRRGIGSELYRSAFAEVAERFGAIVAFTESGAAGEALLLGSVATSGLHRSSLGTLRAVGTLATPLPADAPAPAFHVERVESITPEILDRLESDSTILWNRPSPELWSHVCNDPRGSEILAIQDGTDEVIATARMTRAEVRSAQGNSRVILFESISPALPGPEILRTLVHTARLQLPEGSRPVLVSFPSLGSLPAEILRQAGLRRLPGSFDGHLIRREEDHPFRLATTTNLEIV